VNFQAKLADCGWLAVCRLQVNRFLPIVGEMLSAGGSVRLSTHYIPVITGSVFRASTSTARVDGPCLRPVLTDARNTHGP